MKYTVVWNETAEVDLAALWIEADDRQAIADAADRIDRDLRMDPERKTKVLEGFCFYKVFPLIVALDIMPADRMVRVLRVARAKSV